MKLIAAYLATAVMSVLSIPLVFANGGPATSPYACGRLGVILDTIRTLESGGDYAIRAKGASAAGAYQYITSTWRHWADEAGVSTDLYPTADTAPPHMQDRVAGANVQSILADHDNQIEVVPIIWYYPIALGAPEIMDQVPMPSAGNVLTVREYQTRWLDTYNEKLAATGDDMRTCAATDVTGEWALPLPREILTVEMLSAPHHTYPALDLMVPVGTPVFAVTGGRVDRVTNWNANWWEVGCGGPNPPDDCHSCGIGITIQHPDGLRHTYCHNSRNHVTVGDQIAPGQHIADSGNTGRSGTPHLHLEFRIGGRRHCPQHHLTALFSGHLTDHTPRTRISGCRIARAVD